MPSTCRIPRLLRRSGFPRLAAPLAALLLAAGCSNTYEMQAEARSSPGGSDRKSYTIRHVRTYDEIDTLRYKEAEDLVKKALAGRGMFEAPRPEAADIVVEIDYGLSKPRDEVQRIRKPIYGSGGIRMVKRVVGRDKQGNPIVVEVPVEDAPKEVAYQDYYTREVFYEKHLRLSARENQPVTNGVPPKEIWNVDVTSRDDSRDLRRYLPVMTAVGVEYIGKDSNGRNSFYVTMENGIPVFISGGYDQARSVPATGTTPAAPAQVISPTATPASPPGAEATAAQEPSSAPTADRR